MITLNSPKASIVDFISRCPLWRIVLFGFLSRVVFSVIYVSVSDSPNYLPLTTGDLESTGVDGYIQIAHTLLHHGVFSLGHQGFPVSFRGPTQPLLMLVVCAWSERYWAVLWALFASVMGAATIAVTGKMVRLLSESKSSFAENSAMLLVAFQPYLIFSTKTPSAIATLTLVFTLTCWLWVLALDRSKSLPISIKLGATLGLGLLLHGAFQPLALLAASLLFILGFRAGFLARLKQVTFILATTSVVLSPWIIRNHHTFGEPFPLMTGTGLQYWIADGCYFHGPATTDFGFRHSEQVFKAATGRELTIEHGGVPREDDLMLLSLAKTHLLEHPGLIPVRVFNGAWRFWAPSDSGMRKSFVVAASNLPYLALFCYSLLVGLRNRRLESRHIGLLLLVLCFYGLFATLQAISTYFVVLLPTMLALACDLLKPHSTGSVPARKSGMRLESACL